MEKILDIRDKDYVMVNDIKVIRRKMWSSDAQKLENGISLQLDYAFGCYQTPIRRNTYFVSDDTILYNCGNHLVMYDIVRRKQKYIMKNIEDEAVTAMTFYSNSKGEISIPVGLRSTGKVLPQVKIYSSSKAFSYSLVHSHLMPNSLILDMAFLLQSKFIVTLTKVDHGYALSLFKTAKEKIKCWENIDHEVNKLESGDEDSNLFLLIGKRYLALWNFEPAGSIFQKEKEVSTEIQDEIVDALWLQSGFVVVGTLNNMLYVFKNFSLVQKKPIDIHVEALGASMKEDPKKKQDDQQKFKINLENAYLTCLGKTSNGFACGFANAGMLSLYEVNEMKEALIHKGNYYLKEEGIQKIHSIHIAPDDMYAVLTVVFQSKSSSKQAQGKQPTNVGGAISGSSLPGQERLGIEEERKQQISNEQAGRLEIFIFNLAVVDAIKTVQKDPFEPIFDMGVHKGVVLGISNCPSKQVFMSIAQDKLCKVWEYSSEYREINSQFFHETPQCVALHPLSVQCAIGFKECLKIFYLLDFELRQAYSVNTKSCSAMAYSNGGHMLAASNFNLINIYNPYEFNILYTLSAHANGLKSIIWINNDMNLISVCQYGLMVCWDLSNQSRQLEYTYKAHKINAITYDLEYDLIVSVCEDQKLRVLKGKDLSTYLDYDTSPCQFTSIYISKRFNVIIFGTSYGSIRIYFWPFISQQARLLEYIEIPVHQNSITAIQITDDNAYLITASEDNVIFFSKIREFLDAHELNQADLIHHQHGGSANMDKVAGAYMLNPICLSSRKQQDSIKEQIRELEFRLQNFRSDIEDEKERRQDMHSQKENTLKEKCKDAKNKQRETVAGIFNEEEQKYQNLKEKLSQLNSEFQKKYDILVAENANNLIERYKDRDILQEEKKNLLARFSKQQEQSKLNYQQILKQVEEEYNSKHIELQNKYTNSVTNVNLDTKKFNEVLTQEEMDLDTYLKKTKYDLKEEIDEEAKKTEQLRSDNSRLYKEIERYKSRQNFLNQIISETMIEIQNLEVDQKTFQEKFQLMMHQLTDKEDIINNREQQIKEYRSKNAHLLNFQKVYDYRVTTLKDEHQPLMDHFHNLDRHVKTMYKELLEEASLSKQIEKDIGVGNAKQDKLISALQDKNKFVAFTKRNIETFEFKISEILNTNEFLEWPQKLQNLYEEFFVKKQERIEQIGEASSLSSNLKELRKDDLLEQIERETKQLIGIDLKSQTDFLKKKLKSVSNDYKFEVEDRQYAYLRVQNMNTLLINECNKLREEKKKLNEFLSIQKKAFREVRRELSSYPEYNDQFDFLGDEYDLIYEHFQRLEEEEQNNNKNANNIIEIKDENTKGSDEFSPSQQQKRQPTHSDYNNNLGEEQRRTINSKQSNKSLSSNLTKQNFFSNQYGNNNVQTPQSNERPQRILKESKKVKLLPFQELKAKQKAYSQTMSSNTFPKMTSISSNVTASLGQLQDTQQKKSKEQQLIRDLLKQIEVMNESKDYQTVNDKMRERVQKFLHTEQKKDAKLLPQIQKDNHLVINVQSGNAPNTTSNKNPQGQAPYLPLSRTSKSSQSMNFNETKGKHMFPSSPSGSRTKTGSTNTNMMMTHGSNFGMGSGGGIFGSTLNDFNKKK